MVRLCWVLAVACACSSGNARRPAGPPPVYEPRPVVNYAPKATAEPDPLDALLDGSGLGSGEVDPTVNTPQPDETASPASSAVPNPVATVPTLSPTTAATVPAPVNSKP